MLRGRDNMMIGMSTGMAAATAAGCCGRDTVRHQGGDSVGDGSHQEGDVVDTEVTEAALPLVTMPMVSQGW